MSATQVSIAPKENKFNVKESISIEKETPVFYPSNYLHQGNPNLRSNIYKNPSIFWYLERNSMLHNEKG
ncbi:hypothetical protein JHK87_047895 [Glycine soja]|nr:hypothetical protein JHK87_047895 [Glycine soja]